MSRDNKTSFANAIELAISLKMAEDENVIIFGEDVELLRVNLFTRFGKHRVRNTPISESAFLGAAVTAAMSGLRPIVEIMLVDFIGVCADGLLNHAAKIKFFSGGDWNVPLVVRTSCGGGYGDGGQHEQSLWGWLAHIPGLNVVVPSNPSDAAGLMVSAIEHNDPVVYFEHKLLTDYWLDYLGIGNRKSVSFDVPEKGAFGEIDEDVEIDGTPFGELNVIKEGRDITIVSVGVGVHRALEAAGILEKENISAEVLDLRSIVPIDLQGINRSVEKTGVLVVVDEDYEQFGLSGEISALLLELGLDFKFGRVCTTGTIPFNRIREDATLPNVSRIVRLCKDLIS